MYLDKTIRLLLCLVFIFGVNKLCANGGSQKYFLAIEFNKVICGYSEITLVDSVINGRDLKVLSQEVHFDFSALGRDMSQYQRFMYHIEPETGNFVYHESYHLQEGEERGAKFYVEDGRIRIVSLENPEGEYSDLPEGIILPNTQFYFYLVPDFCNSDLVEKTYQIFDLRTGDNTDLSFKKTGEEKMELEGQVFDAIILEEKNPVLGTVNKLWIDKNTGLRIRTESPSHLNMFLTDESVKTKIKTGNLDDVILGKTNKFIPKIRSIKYMKVRVELDANPKPDIEDLNVRGQSFEGEITDGRVDGIFEIRQKAYNGENSPAFPLDTSGYINLGKWLKPSFGIESDDEVLVEAAREITQGADDLWDAAHSISKWVIENIDGSLLSGTARETFESRKGLCASQSYLMAALCRAAGIPARVVWGVMYIHERGGSFGSHAWNEVFMGEDGWVALDVTSHESNYVDSGHIRFCAIEVAQTNVDYHNMKILEYKSSK